MKTQSTHWRRSRSWPVQRSPCWRLRSQTAPWLRWRWREPQLQTARPSPLPWGWWGPSCLPGSPPDAAPTQDTRRVHPQGRDPRRFSTHKKILVTKQRPVHDSFAGATHIFDERRKHAAKSRQRIFHQTKRFPAVHKCWEDVFFSRVRVARSTGPS